MTPIQDYVALAAVCIASYFLAMSASSHSEEELLRAQSVSGDRIAQIIHKVKDACEADVQMYCAGAAADPKLMKSCMEGHGPQLRASCRSALAGVGLRLDNKISAPSP